MVEGVANETDRANFPLPLRVDRALALLESNIAIGAAPNRVPLLQKGLMTTLRVRKQACCYNALLGTLAKHSGKDTTVCETGFGTAKPYTYVSLALSATVFLSALPEGTRYLGFDVQAPEIEPHVTQASMLTPAQRMTLTATVLNRTMFPGQLHVEYGPSQAKLAPFFAARPSTMCDVLSIDGEHSAEAVMRDWGTLRTRMKAGALVFVDDARAQGKLGFDRKADSAWSRMLASREVRPVGCKVRKGRTEGGSGSGTFCVGEYVGSAGSHSAAFGKTSAPGAFGKALGKSSTASAAFGKAFGKALGKSKGKKAGAA